MPKKRRNPFGDLAHFNPFASRGKSRNYRRNTDLKYRELVRKVEASPEDPALQEELARMKERLNIKSQKESELLQELEEVKEKLEKAEDVAKKQKEEYDFYLESAEEYSHKDKEKLEKALYASNSLRAEKEKLEKELSACSSGGNGGNKRIPKVPGGRGSGGGGRPSGRPKPCADSSPHVFSECFTKKKGRSSIKEARAFLEFEVPKMSPEDCDNNDERIQFAKELVDRADARNRKRQLRRSGKIPTSGRPSKPGAAPEPPTPKKDAVHYEELSGPNGETIRFKLTYENGKFKKRVRAKEEPPIGAVILDLTSGVKAWKRFSDKRRHIPLTSSMKKSYENSFLYKVREFGAGKITFQQLVDKIAAAKTQNKAEGVVFKKMRRKNRKKHK